ncbi:hypothetical protein LX36DRAFT_747370 [Colletotrichum falcatum]|nr:hypothetical protein LX36DRAFT_747370 [Colletotrichum falcatum]
MPSLSGFRIPPSTSTSTCTNITPEIVSFTTEPFPEALTNRIQEKDDEGSRFRSREQIREWVENIFVRNSHEKLLELNTTAELADKKGDECVLTLRKELCGKNHWWQEIFDALDVTTGHYNIAWVPNMRVLQSMTRGSQDESCIESTFADQTSN